MRRENCVVLTGLVVVAVAASDSGMSLGAGRIPAEHRADLAPAVERNVRREMTDLVEFYKGLHANPELSLQEHESARKIAERLKSAGYAVTTGIGGTGVVGILDNGPGPTVLVRGDMDALPIVEETDLPYASKVRAKTHDGQTVGVMHACGHDIHQTCLVGTAATLAALRDRWRGKVMIVAQPAEEIGAGARMMIEDGLFARFGRADYCIALHVSPDHPAGTVSYTPGWALANVDSVDITLYGKGGHGSQPNRTIDPVVTAAHVIVALQTVVSRRVDPREPAVITVGSVRAGSKHNIIPDTGTMQLTVRSYTPHTRRILLDGIREVTRHTARALGCTKDPDVVIREDEYTPSTHNDPALAEAAAEVFRAVLGPDNVSQREPVMGGEDFGRFPAHLHVPGLIFWLGSVAQDQYQASQSSTGPQLPPLHSSTYAPDPAPTIRTGVKALASLALALLHKANAADGPK